MKTLTFRQMEMLRQEARRLKKEKGINHSRALDETAVAQGWRNWAALTESAQPRIPCGDGEPAAPGQRERYYVHGDESEEELRRHYCEFCDRFEPKEHFESVHAEDAGRRTLQSLEAWRKMPINLKLDYKRHNSAINLFHHLYPAPQQPPTPKRVRRDAQSGMFHAWLCEQEWRPDEVGDFARLVASDRNFPVGSDDHKLIRLYCASGSQQEQALFDEAWEDFLEAAGARG